MGGALTLAALADGMNIDCGAPFYGIPPAAYFDVRIMMSLSLQISTGSFRLLGV
jgi:dienelactone hydrolase